MLWSFAFAQPLLDLLGDAPEFFVARDNTAGDIVVLAVAVTVVPPLALTALEGLVAIFSQRARRWLHLGLVALLAAAFVVQLLKDWPGGSGAVLVPPAAALALLGTVLYARTPAVSTALTVLGPAPLVFLAVFLLVSPVSDLVLPGAEAQTSRVAIPNDAPIVMIVFDELSGAALMKPDGTIDAARYPNFARLAHDATWYRNANTVADSTERAVPALLSGDVAEQTAAPIASNYPRSLFTLLGGKYSLDVTERLTDVCPKQLCPTEASGQLGTRSRLRHLASDVSVVSLHLLLPEDLADGLPSIERSFGDFRALNGGEDPGAGVRGLAAIVALGQRTQQFNEWTQRLDRAPAHAHLSFLHVLLPHNPYHFLPSGQRYPDLLGAPPGLEPGAPAGKWSSNRWLARQAFQRYLLQLRYSDRLLGDALGRLRSSGRYDRSLIVVVADHGVSFTPGDAFRDVTPGNVAQIASVPFFVKAPRQRRGRVSDANVQTADVLPTIAAQLRIQMPWRIRGRSADTRTPDGRVEVSPQHGDGTVSLDFAQFVRRRDAVVARIAAAFGESPSDLYRVGPDDDLLGRRVLDLSAGAGRGKVELDGVGALDQVDPNGKLVPSLLSGELTGAPAGARLAVAVDGRVRAVTYSYERDGVRRFAAIVPPGSFEPGANSVDLVSITGAGSNRALALLRGSRLRYRLAGAGAVIFGEGGRRIAIASGRAGGAIDKLSVGDAEIQISGWAGMTHPPREAQLVVAFAGRRFLGAVRPSVSRPDLAQKAPALAHAGFRLAGATPPAPVGAEQVHVYAIVGSRAVELRQVASP